MAKPSRISAKQVRLLGQLNKLHALDNFYLAGGSAVAWRFGHRRSIDLDLFSDASDASLSAVITQMTQLGAEVVAETDIAVNLDASGVPVDVVRYPYAPLERPTIGPGGFRIASNIDLAVMKVSAISRRGLRRDFWDLHVLMTKGRMGLATIIKAYAKRYGRTASDRYHVVRALTFFDDAEKDDPRLIGLSAAEWTRIKKYFASRTGGLLGL